MSGYGTPTLMAFQKGCRRELFQRPYGVAQAWEEGGEHLVFLDCFKWFYICYKYICFTLLLLTLDPEKMLRRKVAVTCP